MNTLVILAGGKSSRMGRDKIFLPVKRGGTFLENLYRRAKTVFEKVIISSGSKEHTKQIRKMFPDAEVIPDKYENLGPIGGLLSVYEETKIEHTAVIPADVPEADMDVLAFFFENCGEDACLFRAEGSDGEPLVGAYGKQVFQRLLSLRENGCYRMHALFSDKTVFYTAEELAQIFPGKEKNALEQSFHNINTEEEYRYYLE